MQVEKLSAEAQVESLFSEKSDDAKGKQTDLQSDKPIAKIPTESLVAENTEEVDYSGNVRTLKNSVGISLNSETIIESSVLEHEQQWIPNSIYEQLDTDMKTVKYRVFYDNQGRIFCRQDFCHEHYIKKEKLYRIPHEHNYSYNKQGQKNGHSDRSLPLGYSNKPSK